MGDDFSVAHAAILASQLPRESRVLRLYNQDLEWSDETGVLVRIDYLLQTLIYALSGGKSGTKPEPIPTPSERQHLEDKLTEAENEMAEVAKILGIGE